jgi:hypothetical protein
LVSMRLLLVRLAGRRGLPGVQLSVVH